MNRTDQIVAELDAMRDVGMLGKQKHARAVRHVRDNPSEYADDTGMSVGECADLAVDMASTTGDKR